MVKLFSGAYNVIFQVSSISKMKFRDFLHPGLGYGWGFQAMKKCIKNFLNPPMRCAFGVVKSTPWDGFGNYELANFRKQFFNGLHNFPNFSP